MFFLSLAINSTFRWELSVSLGILFFWAQLVNVWELRGLLFCTVKELLPPLWFCMSLSARIYFLTWKVTLKWKQAALNNPVFQWFYWWHRVKVTVTTWTVSSLVSVQSKTNLKTWKWRWKLWLTPANLTLLTQIITLRSNWNSVWTIVRLLATVLLMLGNATRRKGLHFHLKMIKLIWLCWMWSRRLWYSMCVFQDG